MLLTRDRSVALIEELTSTCSGAIAARAAAKLLICASLKGDDEGAIEWFGAAGIAGVVGVEDVVGEVGAAGVAGVPPGGFI